MLIGHVSFGQHTNIILQDIDGTFISLTIQDALRLGDWIEEHRQEMLAHLQPQDRAIFEAVREQREKDR